MRRELLSRKVIHLTQRQNNRPRAMVNASMNDYFAILPRIAWQTGKTKMEKHLIIMGSNTGSTDNIAAAESHLRRFFTHCTSSDVVLSKAIGMPQSPPFVNKSLIVASDKTATEIISICKAVETMTGRKPGDKAKGIVRIDIDLVATGGKVLKPNDYNREYAKRWVKVYEELATADLCKGLFGACLDG